LIIGFGDYQELGLSNELGMVAPADGIIWDLECWVTYISCRVVPYLENFVFQLALIPHDDPNSYSLTDYTVKVTVSQGTKVKTGCSNNKSSFRISKGDRLCLIAFPPRSLRYNALFLQVQGGLNYRSDER